jgi:hypothetical protein
MVGSKYEFLPVKDWDSQQQAIPRFLSKFVSIFPDETFELLLNRIRVEETARLQGDYSFHTFGFVHLGVSFEAVRAEKRLELAAKCIDLLVRAKSPVRDYAELFWTVGGYDHQTLDLIVRAASNCDSDAIENVAKLIEKAIPHLAFTHTDFAKALIGAVSGASRQQIIEALAHQARHHPGGGFSGPLDFFCRSI